MTNEATLEKLNLMKLHGMSQSFQAMLETGGMDEATADETLAILVDAEWEWRQENRLNRLVRNARFRYPASLEETNFRLKRNLDKNAVMRFADCSWIRKQRNIIVTGPTGVGKSFIASALGHRACVLGFRVLYFNAAKLFATLKLAKADGSYLKVLSRIQKQELILIDDFGLEHLDKESRLSLLEIMEDRHGVHSTIITSQLPIKTWHDIIGDPTIADAICDRLIHSAFRIELKGESVRKKFQEDLT